MTDKIDLIRGLLARIETADDKGAAYAATRIRDLFHENGLTWETILTPVPADKRSRLAKVMSAIGPGSPQEARNALQMAKRILDGSGLSLRTAFALPAGADPVVRKAAPPPAPVKRMVAFPMYCSKTRQGFIAHAERTGEETLLIVDAKPLPKTSVYARPSNESTQAAESTEELSGFFSIKVAPDWKCPFCGTHRHELGSHWHCGTCSSFHCMGQTTGEDFLGQCGTCTNRKEDFKRVEKFGVHGSAYDKSQKPMPVNDLTFLLGKQKSGTAGAGIPLLPKAQARPTHDPRKLPLEVPQPKEADTNKWWRKRS